MWLIGASFTKLKFANGSFHPAFTMISCTYTSCICRSSFLRSIAITSTLVIVREHRNKEAIVIFLFFLRVSRVSNLIYHQSHHLSLLLLINIDQRCLKEYSTPLEPPSSIKLPFNSPPAPPNSPPHYPLISLKNTLHPPWAN